MNYPINCNAIPANTEYYQEVMEVLNEATTFLSGFKWCNKIVNSQLYLNLGSTLCVFLFEIENTASPNDNYLWIVAGELPPMYLDVHEVKSVKQVLSQYINLADDWIKRVRSNKPLNNSYPFDAEPTIEMAEQLQKRVSFMKNTLLDHIEDITL